MNGAADIYATLERAVEAVEGGDLDGAAFLLEGLALRLPATADDLAGQTVGRMLRTLAELRQVRKVLRLLSDYGCESAQLTMPGVLR